MNFDIAVLLAQDGITTGMIYAMIAVGIVLVFNVTRVVFVSFGDLIAYASLTLVVFQSRQTPHVVWLLAGLALIAVAMESVALVRRNQRYALWRAFLRFGLVPLLAVGLILLFSGRDLPYAAEILLTFAMILPLGPLLYRVVFQPMASASVIVMLMASIALHFALSGLALMFFGSDGYRTTPYVSGSFNVGTVSVSWVSAVIAISVTACVLLLYLFFGSTTRGKALRATAINPVGANLVGISTKDAGLFSFALASGLAAVSGVLIGPLVTVYYDTGFLIGLKAFVGAVVGGFVSYPLSLIGALLIALIESFASFYSSAFKDIVVFGALIPIVLLRWLLSSGTKEIEEEEEI